MSTSTGNDFSQKSDQEIQDELENIKKRLYDKIDTQLEKDLILEEREKLAAEKRNLDIQMRFLKQKMKTVYEDDLQRKEYNSLKSQGSLETNFDPSEFEPAENVFYDITRNGPVSPPKSGQSREYVPVNELQNVSRPRKSKWHPEVGKVSGPDFRTIQTTIDNKNTKYKPNTPRNGSFFQDPFTNSSIKQINHHGKFEQNQRKSGDKTNRPHNDDFSRENLSNYRVAGHYKEEDDVGIKSSQDSNQPHSRLHKRMYYA